VLHISGSMVIKSVLKCSSGDRVRRDWAPSRLANGFTCHHSLKGRMAALSGSHKLFRLP